MCTSSFVVCNCLQPEHLISRRLRLNIVVLAPGLKYCNCVVLKYNPRFELRQSRSCNHSYGIGSSDLIFLSRLLNLISNLLLVILRAESGLTCCCKIYFFLQINTVFRKRTTAVRLLVWVILFFSQTQIFGVFSINALFWAGLCKQFFTVRLATGLNVTLNRYLVVKRRFEHLFNTFRWFRSNLLITFIRRAMLKSESLTICV